MSVQTASKLWAIVPADRRRAAGVLLALTLVGTVLETLGIGVIVPALGLLTARDLASTLPAWMSDAIAARGLATEQLVIVAMLVLVGVWVVKAAFLAFLAWRQAQFTFGLQANISQRLFIGYLRQPWTFHLQRNSAQLLRNVTTEVGNLNNVVQAFMAIGTEGSVLLGLALLLLAVEPVGAAIVIVTLSVAAWGFHTITRARLLRWGEARHRHDGLRIQHVQQGLGGVKDVKLLGREQDFLDQYRRHNDGTARVGQRQFTLQQVPRLWLELLGVVGLAGLVFVMIWQGKPLDRLVPTLGLFAAAAFRLMPSAIRIMNSAQLIRYNLPAVDTLHSELQLIEALPANGPGQAIRLGTAIVLDRVTFKYPTAAAPALEDVSLTIPCGTSVGFVGGSGAGKSTLVDVILGLLHPASGRVLVDGVDVQDHLRSWQDQIGYVPQSIFLTDDTLRRNVAFGLAEDQIDEAAVRRAVRAARLEEFVASLPAGLESMVGERGVQLSGGQRQRVGIARALYHDPPVVVMDEATSALDGPTEQGVMDAVGALRGEKTLLIVAHRLSTVAHCDRLFRLEGGRVVAEGDFESITKV